MHNFFNWNHYFNFFSISLWVKPVWPATGLSFLNSVNPSFLRAYKLEWYSLQKHAQQLCHWFFFNCSTSKMFLQMFNSGNNLKTTIFFRSKLSSWSIFVHMDAFICGIEEKATFQAALLDYLKFRRFLRSIKWSISRKYRLVLVFWRFYHPSTSALARECTQYILLLKGLFWGIARKILDANYREQQFLM